MTTAENLEKLNKEIEYLDRTLAEVRLKVRDNKSNISNNTDNIGTIYFIMLFPVAITILFLAIYGLHTLLN